MSDELLAALAQVDLPFSQAHTPPREVYTDANRHARERALLRDGFPAGSEADLPRPGAWTRVPLVDASLVLLRGADGTNIYNKAQFYFKKHENVAAEIRVNHDNGLFLELQSPFCYLSSLRKLLKY